MKAEIITIGGEILSGRNTDTNGPFLSRQCEMMGVSVHYRTTVADIKEDIANALEIAIKRADIVFTTGGLGATSDDITKVILAETLGKKLEIFPEVLQWFKEYAEKWNRRISYNQLEHFSCMPSGATVLKNEVGTAPAMVIEHDNTIIIALPGPPHELEHLVTEKVVPFILNEYGGCLENIKVKDLWCFGTGEKVLENLLLQADAIPVNPSLAFLPYGPLVNLRLTAKGKNETAVQENLMLWTEKIKNCLEHYAFGEDNDTLEKAAAQEMKTKGLTIAVAEAGCDGLLASALTDVSGSSAYFLGGLVCYSNHIKQSYLGVSEETIIEEGAVSMACAKEMAYGIAKMMQADMGLAVTGITGPSGGTADKPVGLTYIALAHGDHLMCKEFYIFGERSDIKKRAVQYALNMLRLYLSNN